MKKRLYLLLLCLIALIAALAYVYWPSARALFATRLASSSPVAFHSLPIGTRAAQLFWSNRFTEFDRLLDSALADASRPGDIESALGTTCDRGTDARRDAELWQAQMPASLWPALCIGRAYLQQGIQARGRELSANTTPGRFDRMQAAFDDANARLAPFYSDAAYRRAVVIPVLSRLQFAGVNASGDDPTLG